MVDQRVVARHLRLQVGDDRPAGRHRDRLNPLQRRTGDAAEQVHLVHDLSDHVKRRRVVRPADAEKTRTIDRISEIATVIASAVEQQGATMRDITRNIQHAATGATQVAGNVTDVNRRAADTGSASSQVLSSAQSLANESNRLMKSEMGKFLATVRAA